MRGCCSWDTQIHRYRHTDTQTHRYTDTDTSHRYTDTQIQTHRYLMLFHMWGNSIPFTNYGH